MKSTNKQLTAAVVAGAFLACGSAMAQTELYNNAANPTNVDFSLETAGGEFGDQVILDFSDVSADLQGVATDQLSADLQNIFFQYFADVDTEATIRIYENNGDDVTVGSDIVQAPGTKVFDSGPFSLPATVASSVSVPLDGVNVSQSVTWTIEFSSPFAGLSLGGPPSVGDGFTDFWQRDGENWVLETVIGQTDSSFIAIIDGEVVPEPSTWALGAFGALMLGMRLFRRRG